MLKIRKNIWLIMGLILLLFIILFNPIILGKLFSSDGNISSSFLRNILWGFTFLFSLLFLFLLIYPKKITRHIYKNWKNYILLAITIILVLGLIELGLRITSQDKSITYNLDNFEFNYILNTNSQGFHDDEFKKDNTKKIFIIGDSFIYGIVNDEETIDKFLEKNLPDNYEVYNLGKTGANPEQYIETAEKFIEYNPELVILSIYIDNDIQENYNPETSIFGKISIWQKLVYPYIILERKTTCPQEILKIDIDPFYKDLACDEKINYHLLTRAQKGDNQEYYDELLSRFKTNKITKDSILKIKQIYKNTPFILLINPSKYQVSTSDFNELKKLGYVFNENKLVDRKLQDEIISWAKKNNIQVIDVLPQMIQNNQTTYYYKIDDHYNEEGSKLVAEEIYKEIKTLL